MTSSNTTPDAGTEERTATMNTTTMNDTIDANELHAMPWTRNLMDADELRRWLASRKEAGAAIDIATCELGHWGACEADPYGIREMLGEFIAKDVCHPDAFDIANVSDAVSRLDADERATIVQTDSGGRPYKLIIISEPGLYNLSRSSNKPGAKRFWRWVTHDLLATLRKTGSYGAANVGSSGQVDYQLLIELFDRMDKRALEREENARADRAMTQEVLSQVLKLVARGLGRPTNRQLTLRFVLRTLARPPRCRRLA
jgi:prophage antirepressor-like protein